MTPVVRVDGVSRVFRTTQGVVRRRRIDVQALDDVSFEISEGGVCGILGPNGAGKTTLIKIFTTLLLPTAGSAEVLGVDVGRHPHVVRPQIGHVFGGDRGLYDRLSAFDNLRYFCELYRIGPRQQAARIEEMLALTGLTGREHERVEGFSRGMRQRLHIARGLLHQPRVLFLDEPTIGLDPVGARALRDLVIALRDQGTTVVLTTHDMSEADLLCDRVLVMTHGRVVADGTPNSLKLRASASRRLEIELPTPHHDVVARVERLPCVTSAHVEQSSGAPVLHAKLTPGVSDIRAVLDELADHDYGSIQTFGPTLEDAYVEAVTGR